METNAETEVVDTPKGDEGRGLLSLFKLSFGVVLLVVALIVFAQNLESVNIDVLLWEFDIAQVLLLLCTAGLSIFIWEVFKFALGRKKA